MPAEPWEGRTQLPHTQAVFSSTEMGRHKQIQGLPLWSKVCRIHR